MLLEDLFAKKAGHYAPKQDIFVPLLTKFIEDQNVEHKKAAEKAAFRASGIGYCGRYLLYNLQEHTETKKVNEALTLEFGTAIHEILQKYISKMTEGISSELEVELKEIPGVTGHYDYELKIGNKRYLLEIKSCNVEAFQNLILRPIPYNAHKFQTTFYIKALGVDEAILVYVNKNGKLLADFAKEHPEANPQFLEIRYKLEESRFIEIKDKINNLTECFKNDTLPEYKACSQCKWCNFKEKCKEDRKLERALKKNK